MCNSRTLKMRLSISGSYVTTASIQTIRRGSIRHEFFWVSWASRKSSEWLRQRILEGVLLFEAVEEEPIEFGRRFVVDLPISIGEGIVLSTALVRTAWIIRQGEDFPRLTSCFCLQRSL